MNKLKIVIVDDNSDVNILLAAVFSLKGFDTHKTFNPDEYLQKLDELKGMVDLVIMNGKIASDSSCNAYSQNKEDQSKYWSIGNCR